MVENRERRRVARLPVPLQLSGPGPEAGQVRLCDLSPDGARIEHVHALSDRTLCFLDLPRALRGVRLQGEVVWSREVGWKQGAEGKSLVYYQSGLPFRFLTAAQQTALTFALQILRAVQESADTAPPA